MLSHPFNSSSLALLAVPPKGAERRSSLDRAFASAHALAGTSGDDLLLPRDSDSAPVRGLKAGVPHADKRDLALDKAFTEAHDIAGTEWGEILSAPTLTINLNVSSETDKLDAAVIGFPCELIYNARLANPINRMARLTLADENKDVGILEARKEFQSFLQVLVGHGVVVFGPEPIKGMHDQIYTRDPSVVIGDTLVYCNMTREERKGESEGITDLISNQFRAAGQVKRAPNYDPINDEPICFEGGDIFTHAGMLIVGESARTNKAGIAWLERNFGQQFEVLSLKLKEPSETQEALHLDCAFNPIGSALEPTALIHPGSFEDYADVKNKLQSKGWKLVEISDVEQEFLGSNVLSLDSKKIIIRDKCKDLADALDAMGFETIRLKFDAAASLGGLFRCCSMVLSRGSQGLDRELLELISHRKD